MTRKDRRFSYWLLACLILAPSTLTAQEFDPVFIGETLSGEIHDGGVSKAQFSSLQQIEVEGFLANEATEQYFTQNFEAEGTFGELKNGIVVTDWKSLAKAMGTTGAVLAGAYSLWRRRRRSELATIRGGNSKAVEALFQKHFLTSKTSLDGNSEKSLVDPSLIPSSNEEWQVWAASRGIPGASVTLAALFLLWKKKVESPTRTVANDMATASRQREWSTQLSSLRDSSKKHQMEIRTEQRQVSTPE